MGREKELQRLHNLLEGCGGEPVALLGAPGIGKTQLALHFSKHYKSLYPYVTFVSLCTEKEFYTLIYRMLGLSTERYCETLGEE